MTPEDHALTVLVKARIKDLAMYRRWYRALATPGTRAAFASLDREYKAELRSLLRLRRQARQMARQAQIEQDRAVDAWKEREYA